MKQKVMLVALVCTMLALVILSSSYGSQVDNPIKSRDDSQDTMSTLTLEPQAFLPAILRNGVFHTATATNTSTPTVTATVTANPTPTPTATFTATPTDTSTPTPTQCSPAIELTYVPPYGSFEDLRGQVWCVEPDEYRVAVYIHVSGWWNKPYWSSPLTSIREDGSWACDITTGGYDQFAAIIAAFLVPDGYSPPLLNGDPVLDCELYDNSVAHTQEERTRRTLAFSGYDWNVKFSEEKIGPGPNYFSDAPEDAWVDEDGHLHLKIANRDGNWYSTEVFTQSPLGHGRYVFYLASRVDQLDQNVVLGLFTWDSVSPCEYHYREIDIEFSRWGEEEADNSQYVVQPWENPGNRHRFNMELQGVYSTHWFDWRADSIQFSSFHGHEYPPDPSNEIESWLYTGADIPEGDDGNARINLWLLGGNPPADRQEVEVIVEAVEFIPEMR